MANSSVDGCTLRERLDELAPELWKMIYDFTFTADTKVRLYNRDPGSKYGHGLTLAMFREATKAYSEEVVTINEIPHLLHVDRASREKFAQSFYGNPDSLFVVSLGSIPGENTHLKLVKDLRVGVGRYGDGVLDRYWRRVVVERTGRPEQSIPFIDCEDIEALLEERAAVADEQHA
ncbi:hypothetical protein CKM354_000441800 [Cercospora kikuchii]|uniref:Uncharacterized protein n=1 Tax=Cercospora kikuchii TaxID=84275 RepID=A0A9P3FEL2_9PEZI|nr:uncharacterized protein CKM354_000441800 [Cercospora kikuchii]GIZ41102.1 hypothetical protein CKM354_000441800 [Cercospora kikuchii]